MKIFTGTVDRVGTKTVYVTIARTWMHPLYKKAVKRTKRYACQNDGMEVNVGDTVEITECRPMSATKRFKLTSVAKK